MPEVAILKSKLPCSLNLKVFYLEDIFLNTIQQDYEKEYLMGKSLVHGRGTIVEYSVLLHMPFLCGTSDAERNRQV